VITTSPYCLLWLLPVLTVYCELSSSSWTNGHGTGNCVTSTKLQTKPSEFQSHNFRVNKLLFAKYKMFNFSLSNQFEANSTSPHYVLLSTPLLPRPFQPQIIPSTPIPKILHSMCLPLCERANFNQYKKTGKIVVLYLNVYIFALQPETQHSEQNDNKYSPSSTWFNFLQNGILIC
jgi:hypothetical protein